MQTIKASELGSFLYCKRAWWYQLQGEPSANQAAMDKGTQKHEVHARGVKLIPLLVGLAFLLLLAALIVYWVIK
jgi:CRISPR/Cas system-associated exonuclease Cas4 (RecB family)